jgi:hypothetical protein
MPERYGLIINVSDENMASVWVGRFLQDSVGDFKRRRFELMWISACCEANRGKAEQVAAHGSQFVATGSQKLR